MLSLIFKKSFFFSLFCVVIAYLSSAAPVQAGVVPELTGNVVNAVTNAPIANVWVALRTNVVSAPCYNAPVTHTRYVLTDAGGRFSFDGIMPVEGDPQNDCNDPRLGRAIDTNFDGTNDAQEIQKMPITCYTTAAVDAFAPRRMCSYDFGCNSSPFDLFVVKPVGWSGYFVPINDLAFNNAQTNTTVGIGTILYYPVVSTISGTVFVDTNANGTQDTGESGYSGLQITLTGGGERQTVLSNGSGAYSFPNLPDGSYTITIVAPKGSKNTTPTSQVTNVGPNSTINFGLSPLYSVSGSVYIDANHNGIKDSNETNLNASPGITASSGTVTNSLNGTYITNQLTAGAVNISFPNLPIGYRVTTPLNGPPPAFQVTVGSNCNFNGAQGASCQ